MFEGKTFRHNPTNDPMAWVDTRIILLDSSSAQEPRPVSQKRFGNKTKKDDPHRNERPFRRKKKKKKKNRSYLGRGSFSRFAFPRGAAAAAPVPVPAPAPAPAAVFFSFAEAAAARASRSSLPPPASRVASVSLARFPAAEEEDAPSDVAPRSLDGSRRRDRLRVLAPSPLALTAPFSVTFESLTAAGSPPSEADGSVGFVSAEAAAGGFGRTHVVSFVLRST